MKDIECPYCEHEFDICHDDGFGYDESKTHHQRCPACKKMFVFTTCISFDHYPEKAECLNGKAHELERTATYPPEHARMQCKTCGHEEPVPA